ncbi:hypothetical protein Hanom_Chr16g01416171 [Helianthus anomalus]
MSKRVRETINYQKKKNKNLKIISTVNYGVTVIYGGSCIHIPLPYNSRLPA